jgi:hypothetical protein
MTEPDDTMIAEDTPAPEPTQTAVDTLPDTEPLEG